MRKILVIMLGVLNLLSSQIYAQEQEVLLDKIVVTPYRYGKELGKVAASVSLITQEDIKNSNAESVLDILRPVPGLVVRDYYGTGTKASLDLRGFGEQGGMNVLVLVDGRKVNEIDLSGVDWTQIPLYQIERIEVMRGGGSVLYGDNAVSGVVNIITKKGQGKPHFEFQNEIGSYDTNKQNLFFSGSKDALSYSFSGSREGTHGYRKNSYYKAEDFASKLTYDIAPEFSLRFSSGFHSSDYGLPGPLSDVNLQTMSRRSSKYADDHAKDKDYYFNIGANREFGDFGNLDLGLSFRRKDVDTFFLSSYPAPFNPTFKNRIDTLGITPKYVLKKNLLGRDNELIAGIDYYRSDFSSDNYNHSDSLQNFTDINKISLGYYLQNEFYLLKNLAFLSGYRYESAKYEFDYHDNSAMNQDIDQDLKPKQKAYKFGLVYDYQKGSSLFLALNRGFRLPAADEYFSVWSTPPVNTNLKPQISRDYEVGIRHSFNPDLKCDLALFRMNLENELYYNPATFTNENYDKTRHDGLELAFDAKIIKNIGFLGNYTYTKSFFRGGAYDKKNIPMVPRHKGSLGLRFLLPKNISLNLSCNYVGERYFINDQANSFSRLNGYLTADLNISYTYKDCALLVGVNNLSDKEYSEFGICNSFTGAKNYYPSPGRNFALKLECKF